MILCRSWEPRNRQSSITVKKKKKKKKKKKIYIYIYNNNNNNNNNNNSAASMCLMTGHEMTQVYYPIFLWLPSIHTQELSSGPESEQ